jgi:hypothetical protein
MHLCRHDVAPAGEGRHPHLALGLVLASAGFLLQFRQPLWGPTATKDDRVEPPLLGA